MFYVLLKVKAFKGGDNMEDIVTKDDILVAAVCNGDQQAFGRIIGKYTAYVGTIVWNIVQGILTKADAEEVVADVFYILWCHADKVQPGKLKGYLSVVARRRALNAIRKGKRELPLEEKQFGMAEYDPEMEMIQREEYGVLRQTINEMPEPDRTIFILYYYFCRKTADIAREVGLSVSTVQTKLWRGREKLRRKLN